MYQLHPWSPITLSSSDRYFTSSRHCQECNKARSDSMLPCTQLKIVSHSISSLEEILPHFLYTKLLRINGSPPFIWPGFAPINATVDSGLIGCSARVVSALVKLCSMLKSGKMIKKLTWLIFYDSMYIWVYLISKNQLYSTSLNRVISLESEKTTMCLRSLIAMHYQWQSSWIWHVGRELMYGSVSLVTPKMVLRSSRSLSDCQTSSAHGYWVV